MNRIYKYPLQIESRQIIVMPKGAKVLALAEQVESPVLYAEVDPEVTEFEHRIFRLVTTGEIFNAEDTRYVGTQILKGWYAAHVYEQLPHSAPPDPISDRFAEDLEELQNELEADMRTTTYF